MSDQTDKDGTDARARKAAVKAQAELAVREKESQVVRLRATLGLTFAEIAVQVGYADDGGAHKAYKRALARIPAGDVRELRRTEDMRLEHAYRLAVGLAIDPKNSASSRVASLEAMVSISERRAKLWGLDAPAQQVVKWITPDALEQVQEDIEAGFRRLDEEIARAKAEEEALAEV